MPEEELADGGGELEKWAELNTLLNTESVLTCQLPPAAAGVAGSRPRPAGCAVTPCRTSPGWNSPTLTQDKIIKIKKI